MSSRRCRSSAPPARRGIRSRCCRAGPIFSALVRRALVSIDRHAAVDDMNRPGGIARQVGGEIENGTGDLLSPADALQGAIVSHEPVAFLGGREKSLRQTTQHVCVDGAWTNGVDPDVVAELPGMDPGRTN